VRVLLVDACLPVRERLRSLLVEAGPIDVVGEAGTIEAARKLFYLLRPDAVVLDLGFENSGAVSFLAEIKVFRPGCVVLVLSSQVAPESREFCSRLGVDHLLDKSREFERVPEVLLELARSPTGGQAGTT
jgi:DNA-binding NarL/FixJ family response regulator